jgi:ketosteroid isomerase-like protein
MRVLVFVALLVGTSVPASAQATSSPTDAMQALSNGLQSQDAKMVASAFAEDGVVLPPGSGPVRGRAAVEAFWRKQFEGGFGLLDGGSYGTSASGDLAYEWGYVTISGNRVGGESMKYLNVLRRDAQGTWSVAFSTWNSNEAAAAAASPRP